MHRYIGRNRNAGYGYPLHLRLRRQLAYWLGESAGWEPGLRCWLGYRIDFNRDRYLEEYWAGDEPQGVWEMGVPDEMLSEELVGDDEGYDAFVERMQWVEAVASATTQEEADRLYRAG